MARRSSGIDETMSPQEKRTAYSLAAVYTVRMLGLFMILPIFTAYGAELKGHTPFLIGLALGIYGLTQALFQVPLGMLSDRLGRKPVIVFGFLFFITGSVIAALAHTITGIIIGRAFQGAGAISASVMALAADLTRDEHRTKIMASIGVSIGIAFTAGLALGPLLNSWIGVPGIFWTTAALGLVAIAIVSFVVPSPLTHHRHRDTEVVASSFGRVLRHPELLRLDFGIFVMQFILTATFVVMPILLAHLTGVPVTRSWELYLPVMIVAFLIMVPFIIIAEKRRHMRRTVRAAIAILVITNVAYLYAERSLPAMVAGLIIFFSAFNTLEASLPSLVAKTAPPDQKGTAMGVYSTSQFLGIFLGGTIGGAAYGAWGITGTLLINAALAGVWLVVASGMREPRYVASYVLRLKDPGAGEEALRARLANVPGVDEVAIAADEGVAYLKIDRAVLQESDLRAFAADSP